MRLANGIVIDKEKTFGQLKFSALRREVRVQNEDGTKVLGNKGITIYQLAQAGDDLETYYTKLIGGGKA